MTAAEPTPTPPPDQPNVPAADGPVPPAAHDAAPAKARRAKAAAKSRPTRKAAGKAPPLGAKGPATKAKGSKAAAKAGAARKRKPRAAKAAAPLALDAAPEPIAQDPAVVETTPLVTLAPAAEPAPMRVGRLLLVGLLVLGLAMLGVATQVVSALNTGTIKVHDGPTADPDTRNEPHVSGDLYVEGTKMAEDSGGLFFFSWPPTGNGELVLQTTWDADDGEPAFHFLAGPFVLACGHYRVGASNGPAEPEDFPTMKTKAFWVECEEEPEPEPEPTPTSTGPSPTSTGPSPTSSGPSPTSSGPSPTTSATSSPTTTATTTSTPSPTTTPTPTPTTTPSPEPEPGPELECPADLAATALEGGGVRLTWSSAPGSDGTNVYRAEGDGDFEYLTTTPADVVGYVDTTATAGAGYAYVVTGLFGNEESEDCAIAEVTAIPDMPTLVASGLAMGGSLLAFAVLARRRKT